MHAGTDKSEKQRKPVGKLMHSYFHHRSRCPVSPLTHVLRYHQSLQALVGMYADRIWKYPMSKNTVRIRRYRNVRFDYYIALYNCLILVWSSKSILGTDLGRVMGSSLRTLMKLRTPHPQQKSPRGDIQRIIVKTLLYIALILGIEIFFISISASLTFKATGPLDQPSHRSYESHDTHLP